MAVVKVIEIIAESSEAGMPQLRKQSKRQPRHYPVFRAFISKTCRGS
jgi:hypothetical protein